MVDSKKTYEKLLASSKKSTLFKSISQLLEWDQETYMPKEGALVRADQLELLASLHHKEKTSPAFRRVLSQLIDIKTGVIKDDALNRFEIVNLKQWRREYLIAKSLPNKFVRDFARLCTESLTVWTQARKNNDFASYLPYLKKIVQMSRKKAVYLGYEKHPYDALLDLHEPEMKTHHLFALFNPLKEEVSSLLKKIKKCSQIDDSFLHGNFSTEKQLEFGHLLMQATGYETNKGRLDLSTHPFSMSLHPYDSRITTRIHKSSLMECISAVLHEVGHSLYEMGLPIEYFGTPLCDSISLGIHESQSRFWETRVGQSLPFWKHFLPILQKIFPHLDKIAIHQFYKAINKVEPGFIRIESDEVCYSLHIILRFELEVALMEGSIEAEQIPQMWNEKMEQYLGIIPPSDSQGCLQDIHWSMGGFGYFPTYTLGNLYAAQFFNSFEKVHPDWKDKMEKGDLLFIKDWLNKNIHRHGKYYSAEDLAKQVTGKKLHTESYLAYLNKKYQDIYSF